MSTNWKVTIENSSLVNECVCGAKMQLRMVEPKLFMGREVDVLYFDCTECVREVRLIWPRELAAPR